MTKFNNKKKNLWENGMKKISQNILIPIPIQVNIILKLYRILIY